MDATQTLQSAVTEWFEGSFKESAKATTKTSRLDDGRLSYSFSVVNDSGLDFDDFSFRIKVIDKAKNEEIGTATIKAGEWKTGEKKNFRSKLSIPPDVKSLSFVMYANSLKYRISEENESDLQSMLDGMDDAMRDIGNVLTGGTGGVFGELFGNGGMPETGSTTTTRTTTTRSSDGTTKTTTTTTTTRGGRSGTVNAGGQTRTVSPGRQAGGAQSYTQRKTDKKLNKMRLGRSGWTVVALVVGLLFLISAAGATEVPVAIAYGVTGLIGLIAAGISKIVLSRRAKRIRTYESKVNYNGNTYIDDLAAAVGRPYDKVADELQQMTVDGFFPGAYVDFNNRLLVMTRDGKPIESVEKTVALGNKARRRAGDRDMVPQSLDDLITMTDDADIKTRLKKLRTITKKIDARVEEVPELGKQVKEFREKYYPEVVRLTDDYNDKIADLAKGSADKPKEEVTTSADGAPVINTNPNYLEEQAAGIKSQLVSLIDSVIEASENLLERLYEDDLMDITTDIQSLQTTLASKGLLDSDFDI